MAEANSQESSQRARFGGGAPAILSVLESHATNKSFVRYSEEANVSKARIDKDKLATHAELLADLRGLQENFAFSKKDVHQVGMGFEPRISGPTP
eukprot:10700738-Alexandrium_andersonii.AAC.1